jgi:hypothetical protein
MTDSRGSGEHLELGLSPEEESIWEAAFGDDSRSLAELVNKLLDRGVVITGDVTISIAGVDLVYLGLNAVLTSVATARSQLARSVGTSGLDT